MLFVCSFLLLLCARHLDANVALSFRYFAKSASVGRNGRSVEVFNEGYVICNSILNFFSL